MPFKTEELVLSGEWQEITKEMEVKNILLKLETDTNSFEISHFSDGSEKFTIPAGNSISISEEPRNESFSFYIKGTAEDVLEIIKQR